VPDTCAVSGVVAWLRRYFLFETWTWAEPAEAARQRSRWPLWRRAVRPVGAVAWWAGLLLGRITGKRRDLNSVSELMVSVLLAVVVLACVVYGVVDGFRERRREGTDSDRPTYSARDSTTT
jgi:hypothetical protein